MRPATSGRSVTDSSERRLPTAVIVCRSATVVTFAASTVTGAAPPLPAASDAAAAARAGAFESARWVPNQYAPATAPTIRIAAMVVVTALAINEKGIVDF